MKSKRNAVNRGETPNHKDMLASIRMEGEVEVAQWFHRGTHVFTVRTGPDGKPSYKSVVE